MSDHDWYSFDIRRTAQEFEAKMIEQDNAVRHAREDHGRMMAEYSTALATIKEFNRIADERFAEVLHLGNRLDRIPYWVQRFYKARP